MELHLFAGLRVGDFERARPWYEQLLGHPSFFPHETEAVWQLADGRSIFIVEDAERAGGGTVAVVVDDLEARVAEIAQRGLELTDDETYANGVRKVIYRDAEANEIGFASVPA